MPAAHQKWKMAVLMAIFPAAAKGASREDFNKATGLTGLKYSCSVSVQKN